MRTFASIWSLALVGLLTIGLPMVASKRTGQELLLTNGNTTCSRRMWSGANIPPPSNDICDIICVGDVCTTYECPDGVCCTPGSPSSLCCAYSHPLCVKGGCCVAGHPDVCHDQCCTVKESCCASGCCEKSCCGESCCEDTELCCGDRCCEAGEFCCADGCCERPCCGPFCCEHTEWCCGVRCCDVGDVCCGTNCCNSTEQVCCGGQTCCDKNQTCCGAQSDQCCGGSNLDECDLADYQNPCPYQFDVKTCNDVLYWKSHAAEVPALAPRPCPDVNETKTLFRVLRPDESCSTGLKSKDARGKRTALSFVNCGSKVGYDSQFISFTSSFEVAEAYRKRLPKGTKIAHVDVAPHLLETCSVVDLTKPATREKYLHGAVSASFAEGTCEYLLTCSKPLPCKLV